MNKATLAPLICQQTAFSMSHLDATKVPHRDAVKRLVCVDQPPRRSTIHSSTQANNNAVLKRVHRAGLPNNGRYLN